MKENEDYKLLGWSNNLSPFHYDGYKKNNNCIKEPEVIYFPKIKWIGWQGHPEMMFRNSEFDETMNWSMTILNQFLDDKL